MSAPNKSIPSLPPIPVERPHPKSKDTPAKRPHLKSREVADPASYQLAPPLPPYFVNLTESEVAGVKLLVFFVGYGRSGHSIVGSILDAHPNMVIAHEYYLFEKLLAVQHEKRIRTKANLFNELYWNSYHSTVSGWRSDRVTRKGYNLRINGTWQGQFDQRLSVIGDKTGGSTAAMYHTSPQLFKAALKRLDMLSGIPHAAIHVVRNPYDMIATVALFHASGDPDYTKVEASVTNKFNQLYYLELATNIVLTKAAGVGAMVAGCRLNLLEVHLEDLIANPRTEIQRMCDFLGVACAQDYLTICEHKVYKYAPRSRDVVEWPYTIRQRVGVAIQQFSFFNRYSFN